MSRVTTLLAPVYGRVSGTVGGPGVECPRITKVEADPSVGYPANGLDQARQEEGAHRDQDDVRVLLSDHFEHEETRRRESADIMVCDRHHRGGRT